MHRSSREALAEGNQLQDVLRIKRASITLTPLCESVNHSTSGRPTKPSGPRAGVALGTNLGPRR